MSQYFIKNLNYITAGKTEKLISLTVSTDNKNQVDKIFVCDIDENIGIFGNSNSNRSSFKIKNLNIIIHNLYDISDLLIKSNIQKNQQNYIDIYAPSLDNNIINICQLKNYVYCLTDLMSQGPNMLVTDLRDQRKKVSSSSISDTFFSYKFISNNIQTYLYNKNNDSLSGIFEPVLNIDGVNYNYIFEIPLSYSIYNNFSEGEIFGETFQGKNSYGSDYSMHVSLNNGNLNLANARKYCGIGVCGDNLFLKYFDNLEYNFNYLNNYSDGVVYNVKAVKKENNYTYQKIESIAGFNKFDNSSSKHKSNLFSINIKNTNIDIFKGKYKNGEQFPDDLNEKIKLQIKTDIKNQVKILTEKFCPANTCLFDVYFDGKSF